MKTIVILLAVSLVAVLGDMTEEDRAKKEQMKEECIEESGVDRAVLKKAKEGEPDENDEKLACFGTCILKKMGTLKENGEVDWERVREHMLKHNKSEEEINKLRTECENVDGEGCQKGKNLFKCFKQVVGHH
ncbi:PREDICTED: general odorant-binding protein 56a-like [Trachymyrmex cornetzi]|uniref:general odorant-binding protein 56a-like n=1 Tax=Trachymyrmex cornetzi TaxID=471704 RepID=UPI00084EE67F|nr:PREDICTED: general odorant-binding protein 56a-like [Trachymyrmex cornetzi]